MPPALIAIAAAAISAAATGAVLRYARRRLLDQVTERSSHSMPTPRGGGLGLVLGLLPAWLIGLPSGAAPEPLLAAAAVAGITALGWWDDHADLPARRRLAAQFACAGLALWAVGIPEQARIGPWSIAAPAWLAGGIALVGAVWMVNLYNFMDGIDGIAGGQGLVAGAAAGALLAGTAADPAWAALGWATAGACAGFLVWNRPPARIFMGDVGSTALGLAFAILVLAQVRAGVPLDLALLPLAPFALDATCTLARRAWRRERLAQAHRSHLYQRLARAWGGHLPVTALYAGIALAGAAGAWLTVNGHLPPPAAVATVAAGFAALVIAGRRCAPA